MFKNLIQLGFKKYSESKSHIYYRGTYRGDDCVINIYPLAETYGVHTSYVIDKELHHAISLEFNSNDTNGDKLKRIHSIMEDIKLKAGHGAFSNVNDFVDHLQKIDEILEEEYERIDIQKSS